MNKDAWNEMDTSRYLSDWNADMIKNMLTSIDRWEQVMSTSNIFQYKKSATSCEQIRMERNGHLTLFEWLTWLKTCLPQLIDENKLCRDQLNSKDRFDIIKSYQLHFTGLVFWNPTLNRVTTRLPRKECSNWMVTLRRGVGVGNWILRLFSPSLSLHYHGRLTKRSRAS